MAGMLLCTISMVLSVSYARADEGGPRENEQRYQAAVSAAEARFQQSVKAAQDRLLRDLTAARSILNPSAKPADPGDTPQEFPVSVVGADPVSLKESRGRTGWTEIPTVAAGAVIFETRKDDPKDGVVQFQVTRNAVIGLAASWAYDGNASGGWQEDRKSKKDLLEGGWIEVGSMYHNLTDRHTLFVRQCKQGDEFGIRTRKYRRPLVFIPGVLDAKQQPVEAPDPATASAVEVLAAEPHPTEDFLPNPDQAPGQLEGTTAFVSPLSGVAIIRVNRREQVFVAASWQYDGNRAGQWTQETWSKQDFIDRGWKEIGEVQIKHRGSNQPHVLFARDCNKGDRFRIRTRKYGAPFVFATLTD